MVKDKTSVSNNPTLPWPATNTEKDPLLQLAYLVLTQGVVGARFQRLCIRSSHWYCLGLSCSSPSLEYMRAPMMGTIIEVICFPSPRRRKRGRSWLAGPRRAETSRPGLPVVSALRLANLVLGCDALGVTAPRDGMIWGVQPRSRQVLDTHTNIAPRVVWARPPPSLVFCGGRGEHRRGTPSS